jgi:protein arginine kinase activator
MVRLMTCQRCQDEASVHLTETTDGQRRELHLCVPCARKAGLAPPEPEPPAPLTLDKVVQDLILTHVGELVGELANLACPTCGIKYMEYRTRGRLGCPRDYEVFARGLLPQLHRTQGATRHVGKVIRPSPAAAERLQLRAQLRAAITREDYEQAAQLRNQLRLKDVNA